MLSFHKRADNKGSLVFLEGLKDIPFDIKRIYYIHGVDGSSRRGFHAHKELHQVLICVHGSCKIMLDDGTYKADVTLNNPAEGLLVEGIFWREMYDFSSGAVLLVLASDYYDENDYIRDYNEFLQYVEARK